MSILTQPQNLRLFSRNIYRLLDSRSSIEEHVRLGDTVQFEGLYEWLSVGRQTALYVELGAYTTDARKVQAEYSLFSNPFPSPQHSHHFTDPFILSCLSGSLLSFQSY